MSPVQPRPALLTWALLIGVSAVIGLRLWTSFCFFPLAEWNNVRLAPTFMLWSGPSPYPGLGEGPVTTWIYGPVPLLLNLPAVLATGSGTALLIAAALNLLGAILPAAAAILLLPAGLLTTRTAQVQTLLLCLAIWPNPSLQYIQADNWAVAFGLLSNALLLRRPDASGLLAGLCAALAVWSKQTTLGLVLAQVLWLGLTAGPRPAARHAAICAGWGLTLGSIFIAWFGWDGLWLNLIRIPGQLPFVEEPWARTLEFKWHLLGYVLLPAAGMLALRRVVWKRDSPWLLPVLTWLCLLPGALAATYRTGGATNSLNGFLYLLPLTSAAALAALQHITSRTASAWLAAATLAIIAQQLASAPLLPLRPLTTQLAEADGLAHQFPGRVYFPWHPLVTYFSEQRFYHAEDGLYTRSLAGLPPDPAAARRELPPQWYLTAIPGWRNQGFYKQLQPASARLGFYGKWSVYTWLPDSPEPK